MRLTLTNNNQTQKLRPHDSASFMYTARIVVIPFMAAYVKTRHPDVHTVYMVGEDGLEEELGMVGLKIAKEEARPAPGMTEDEFRENSLHPEVRRFRVRFFVSGLGWIWDEFGLGLG